MKITKYTIVYGANIRSYTVQIQSYPVQIYAFGPTLHINNLLAHTQQQIMYAQMK